MMKRSIIYAFIFIIALFTSSSGSDNNNVPPRDLLVKSISKRMVSKYLIDTVTFIPLAVSQWRALLPPSNIETLIKDGIDLSNFKFEALQADLFLKYIREGNREIYSSISFKKREVLFKLVLAESIERKGRFINTIINGIWSICEESYWGIPPHLSTFGFPNITKPEVDIFTSETAAILALTSYLLSKELDDVDIILNKRIRDEVNFRFLKPLLLHPDYRWLQKETVVNNWNPWIISNFVFVGLLIEHDNSIRNIIVSRSLSYLDIYLNGFKSGGGCEEGPNYWFDGVASLFDALILLEHFGLPLDDLRRNPFLKDIASYIYKVHISENYFINIADSEPKINSNGLVLYRIGKFIYDDTLKNLGSMLFKNTIKNTNSTVHPFRYITDLFFIQEIMSDTSNYIPVKNVWIDNIQLFASRTKSIFLAVHGGNNNESHNHNDVGDMIIYKKGQPIIIDVGKGNYTANSFSKNRYELWYTSSGHHNLPILNGCVQEFGSSFKANLIDYHFSEDKSHITFDLSLAYPSEAGIHRLERNYILDNLKEEIIVSDSFSFQMWVKNPTFEQVFMTIATIHNLGNGRIELKNGEENSLILQYDVNLWQLDVDYPNTTLPDYISFKYKWNSQVIKRLILRRKNVEYTGINTFKFY